MSGQSSLTPQAKTDDTAFFGHPRGLSTLFFTEMWERFSYYGMRALLTLYLVSSPEIGALGYSNKLGGLVYGLYTGLVYALGLPGGWIADRFLGQRKAVTVGAVLIIAGHVCLAIPVSISFFIGLGLVCVGTGFLKPNVSTMVGQLYADDDVRKDAGYSIYYMGINLGAGLGPFVLGWLGQEPSSFVDWLSSRGLRNLSWHVAFGASALGMLIGLIQYRAGQHRLKEAGLRPTPPKDAAEAAKNRRILVYMALGIFGLPTLVGLLGAAGVVELTRDRVDYGCLTALLLVAAGFFAAMFAKAGPREKGRVAAILALFFGAVFFFSVFEQAGSTFTVFADQHTHNSVLGFAFPSSWWQGVNSGFIIVLSPVFAALWGYLANRKINPPWPLKFGVGLILVALGCLVMLPAAHTAEGGGKAGPSFLLMLYFLHTCGELCLSPVGLSSTSKVAPKSIAGLAMGVWFMGTGIGNYLSGMYLGATESLPLSTLFIVMSVPPILGGLVFLALNRPLRRASES